MKIIIKKTLAISLLTLFASSCINEERALEGALIEKDSLINSKQFVKESKERAEKVVEFGPKTSNTDTDVLKKKNRVLIDKEIIKNSKDVKTIKDFPISLNVENIGVRPLTQMLAKITNVNFLVSDEVSGLVTAKLKNVRWSSALDSILNLKKLAKHVDNNSNIIRIHSQEAIVELEEFERKRKEDLQRTAELDRINEPLQTEVFKLYYTDPEEVKNIISEVLTDTRSNSAANAGGNNAAQITIDKRVNQLIVKARKNELNMVEKLISKLDLRTNQIFIEAFIVEVNDDFEKRLGVRLGADISEINSSGDGGKPFNVRATGLVGASSTSVSPGNNNASISDFAVAGATSGIGGLFGIGDAADLKVALTALERDEVSKIISNPRIFTLDNQEAVIFQGTEVPYETVSQDGTSIEFKSAGLNLAVTPTVIGDGNLKMSISLNKDSVDTSQDNPPITSSLIRTNLVTKDGSIVVIGGIYSQSKTDSEEKVPFFGDLPFIGRLFRGDSRTNDRKELMIFIAPRVI